ncbi:MAG: hypothetical protein ICV83_25610, partial [Cytophagales bacterium]|nr:hypothetical protein [Cytophagales bacterium]
DYVITLDEMPALRGYVRKDTAAPVTGLHRPVRRPSLRVYPTVVRDALRVENNRSLGVLEVYNALGGCVRRQYARENQATLSLAGLPAGFYVVVADRATPVKVWKE